MITLPIDKSNTYLRYPKYPIENPLATPNVRILWIQDDGITFFQTSLFGLGGGRFFVDRYYGYSGASPMR
jgi:hypothetical protein